MPKISKTLINIFKERLKYLRLRLVEGDNPIYESGLSVDHEFRPVGAV